MNIANLAAGCFTSDVRSSFSEESDGENCDEHHSGGLNVSTEWLNGGNDVGARALSDLSWLTGTDVFSIIGGPELETALGSVQAESSVGVSGVGGGTAEEVREGGAAWSNGAIGGVIASNSGGNCSVEGIHVEHLSAEPEVVNTIDGESDIVELDGCTDRLGGTDGSSTSSKFSAAVVAWARVSGSAGCACSRKCSGGCDSGWVAGLGKNHTVLEVSAFEELSWSDGAEGDESNSLEHLIYLFESFFIDYKVQILFSFCSLKSALLWSDNIM
jgi:hypothetical protein